MDEPKTDYCNKDCQIPKTDGKIHEATCFLFRETTVLTLQYVTIYIITFYSVLMQLIFRGILNDVTLRELLRGVDVIHVIRESNRVDYVTNKSRFTAVIRNQVQWNIFQMTGEIDDAGDLLYDGRSCKAVENTRNEGEGAYP